MTRLVDTNVLLDLVTRDPTWASWSLAQMEESALAGTVAINAVIYAELSVRYARIEDLDHMLEKAEVQFLEMPRAALFLAGKAFRRYRMSGGKRTGVLPDFFIGAHAAVMGLELITRDASRYRTYFPALVLIAPANY